MGWGPFLYGMTVVLNLSFLPLGDGKFGGVVRAGQEDGRASVLFVRHGSRLKDARSSVLLELRTDYELFVHASSIDDVNIRKVVLLHLVEPWEVGDELVHHLEKRCMALKQIRIVEDKLLTQRWLEEKSPNKYISPLKVYKTLVEKRIVDLKYHYCTDA
eukprot:1255876-Amphidinium_carterae.1